MEKLEEKYVSKVLGSEDFITTQETGVIALK